MIIKNNTNYTKIDRFARINRLLNYKKFEKIIFVTTEYPVEKKGEYLIKKKLNQVTDEYSIQFIIYS